MNELTHELSESFQSLMMRLEPENLSCDGELSRTTIKARYSQIMREWKELEKKAGRKVTQDEIQDAWIASIRKEMKDKTLSTSGVMYEAEEA